MGGWKLEVGKMVVYMAFPVGLFHYFNQPEYYAEWVTKVKQELYPPDNKRHREMMEQAVAENRKKAELRMLQALEKNDK